MFFDCVGKKRREESGRRGGVTMAPQVWGFKMGLNSIHQWISSGRARERERDDDPAYSSTVEEAEARKQGRRRQPSCRLRPPARHLRGPPRWRWQWRRRSRSPLFLLPPLALHLSMSPNGFPSFPSFPSPLVSRPLSHRLSRLTLSSFSLLLLFLRLNRSSSTRWAVRRSKPAIIIPNSRFWTTTSLKLVRSSSSLCLFPYHDFITMRHLSPPPPK